MDWEAGPEQKKAGQVTPATAEASTAPLVAVQSRQLAGGAGADPRIPVWIRRAVIAVLAGIIIGIWQDWRLGVTVAAVIAIADTVYQSKRMTLIPAAVRVTSAQRKTRRRLLLLRQAGYLALHAREIPGTGSVIDHLVIGPPGVFTLDSQRWDRRLPVRTVAGSSSTGAILYHGPFSQKERLAHARWEAAQAARLVSAELEQQLAVRPAMVIYGPTIPWSVTTLRGVDVFGGRRVGRYFRNQRRAARGSRLSREEIEMIYDAAERALPPVSSAHAPH